MPDRPHFPTPSDVWKAIRLYLEAAYGAAGPPSAVRKRLEQLRLAEPNAFYESPVWERHTHKPRRLALRLGNPHYPHMKLRLDPRPDGGGHLFSADTHDQHIRPSPGARDYDLFVELMEKNRQIAHAIESAWTHEGLPTFKSFLQEDLNRRKAAGTAGGTP